MSVPNDVIFGSLWAHVMQSSRGFCCFLQHLPWVVIEKIISSFIQCAHIEETLQCVDYDSCKVKGKRQKMSQLPFYSELKKRKKNTQRAERKIRRNFFIIIKLARAKKTKSNRKDCCCLWKRNDHEWNLMVLE